MILQNKNLISDVQYILNAYNLLQYTINYEPNTLFSSKSFIHLTQFSNFHFLFFNKTSNFLFIINKIKL